jgi:hypothetical protein
LRPYGSVTAGYASIAVFAYGKAEVQQSDATSGSTSGVGARARSKIKKKKEMNGQKRQTDRQEEKRRKKREGEETRLDVETRCDLIHPGCICKYNTKSI